MLDNISKLTKGKTRLFTGENVYGEKGKGGRSDIKGEPLPEILALGQNPDTMPDPCRELGKGWKVRPCITIKAGQTIPVIDVDAQGAITHIWFTMEEGQIRNLVVRMYWDGEENPSVEAPVGDFFCQPFHRYHPVTAIPMNVNPHSGMNCFFPMPFRKHARITVENVNERTDITLFYAVSMNEREVGEDEAYFHAQFRRTRDTREQDYVIVDGIKGRGQYVGTAIGWQQNTEGWWGEGEIKAYIDGDTEYPSYIGTGTEDYFGGAWCFGENYTAPFLGYKDVSNYRDKRNFNSVGNRHAMYRFHIPDPIHFEEDLKVTIQTLGWRSECRYQPLMDDVCSVAYWYQTEPHAAFPGIGTRNDIECV